MDDLYRESEAKGRGRIADSMSSEEDMRSDEEGDVQSWHTPPQEEDEMMMMTMPTMSARQRLELILSSPPPPEEGSPRSKNQEAAVSLPNVVLPLQEQQEVAAAAQASSSMTQVVLLFLAAIGSTISWTAVLSNLVFYTQQLGPNSFWELNVAVYSPLLPMALAQARWDSYFHRYYQTWRSFSFRGHVGYLTTCAALLGLVHLSSSSSSSIWSHPTNSDDNDHHHIHTKNMSHQQRAVLLILTTFLGTASGVLQGSLRQIPPILYPGGSSSGGGGRLAAAVTAGMQASALIVLALSILVVVKSRSSQSPWRWWSSGQHRREHAFTGHFLVEEDDDHEPNVISGTELAEFYRLVTAAVTLCWFAFTVFMWQCRDQLMTPPLSSSQHGLGMSSSRTSLRMEQPLLLLDHEESEDEEESSPGLSSHWVSQQMTLPDEEMQGLISGTATLREGNGGCMATTTTSTVDNEDVELSYQQLWNHTWPLCIAIMVTVASSMSVASWFNRVQSVDPSMEHSLPQILFYTRLFADLLGRPASLLVTGSNHNHNQLQSQLILLSLLTCLRLLFVPYFFLAYSSSASSHGVVVAGVTVPRSDLGVIVGVAGFAFSSGLVVTVCYQVAPALLLLSPSSPSSSSRGRARGGGRSADSLPSLTAPTTTSVINNTANQARLLNVCFSISVILGLMASGAVSTLHVS